MFDRLTDTPAEIVTELGETLRQNALGAALTGDASRRTGRARSIGYRWFTDPAARELHPAEDHEFYSRMYVSGLRGILTLRGPGSRAADLTGSLLADSEEFRDLWDEHEVGIRPRELKLFLHPDVGLLELSCQILLSPDDSQSLLVYTAVPGSESHDRLQLLSVIAAPTV